MRGEACDDSVGDGVGEGHYCYYHETGEALFVSRGQNPTRDEQLADGLLKMGNRVKPVFGLSLCNNLEKRIANSKNQSKKIQHRNN